MPMKIRFNPRQLEASIQNIADRAGKNASAELRKVAIKIRDLARDYAPRKSGTLEEAIDYAAIKDGRRNMFVVFINMDVVAPGGKMLGDYAWVMEEELHPHGRKKGKRYYTLGAGSKRKAAGGKKVGGRFMRRAVKDGTKDLLKDVTNAVGRTLGGRVTGVKYERDTGGDEE